MAELERFEDILRDLRADEKSAARRAKKLAEEGRKEEEAYADGQHSAFNTAANRIAGEIEELRYA